MGDEYNHYLSTSLNVMLFSHLVSIGPCTIQPSPVFQIGLKQVTSRPDLYNTVNNYSDGPKTCFLLQPKSDQQSIYHTPMPRNAAIAISGAPKHHMWGCTFLSTLHHPHNTDIIPILKIQKFAFIPIGPSLLPLISYHIDISYRHNGNNSLQLVFRGK